MTFPEWFKPSALGAIGGAAVLAFAGFTWGGWVTAGAAEGMAFKAAKTNVTAAMVPVCVSASERDPERASKLDTIRAETPYRQRQAVMDAGWATPPGSDMPDRDVAEGCLAELDLDIAQN
jgi:hypothetical protein